MGGDPGAVLYIRGGPRVLYLGFLPDVIDREGDAVGNALRLHDRLAPAAVQGEWHGEDGLEGVTLRAPGRGHVGLSGADPHRVIKDLDDYARRNTGAAVGDRDPVTGHVDMDAWRRPGFLARVDRVIDQLLQDDQRPLLDTVSRLVDQLLAGAELQKARSRKRLAVQSGLCCHGVSPPKDLRSRTSSSATYLASAASRSRHSASHTLSGGDSAGPAMIR